MYIRTNIHGYRLIKYLKKKYIYIYIYIHTHTHPHARNSPRLRTSYSFIVNED